MARSKDVRDNGFRNFSESAIRRFYGDVGYRTDSSEFHLNMGVANNNFGAAATVPVELLQNYWGATYTTPQTTNNRVAYLNLTGKVEATPTWTIEGAARVRAFQQKTVDGNPTATQPCDADPALLCFNDDSAPANGLNGVQLANPFPDTRGAGADRPDNNPFDDDRGDPAGNQHRPAVRAQQPVHGRHQFRLRRHPLRGQRGIGHDRFKLRRQRQRHIPRAIRRSDFDRPGLASRHQPLHRDLCARHVRRDGRVFDLGRRPVQLCEHRRFEDQIGTELNGNHTFSRFNPMIGGTYKITPELTAYAGYSEANRAPTPLELACADPARPCIIAAFLIADPPLKQVVSRTVEAGFRGTKELNIGTLGWKVGAFRATNADDILAIPSPELQGFGYFQNVGRTRRQGIEAQVNLTSKTLQLYASYALVDARFLDSLQVGSNSPFADADGNVQIVPGNRIPAIPRNRVKFGMDYSITDAFKVGGDALFVSNQYFVGDESNQAPRLPSYTVFNLHASYQITKNIQIYGRVDNVFDNRYAAYGTFFETDDVPNFANGGAPFTDARSVSPARPRAFYAGVKATF